MAKFKVGDLCVVLPHPEITSEWGRKQSGTIVEILALERPPGMTLESKFYFRIWYKVSGIKEEYWASEEVLEKIPPKREDLGSWDVIARDTGYKIPTKVPA